MNVIIIITTIEAMKQYNRAEIEKKYVWKMM